MWGWVSIAVVGDGLGHVARNTGIPRSWEQSLANWSREIGTSVLQPQETKFFHKHLQLKEIPKFHLRKQLGRDPKISLVDSEQRTQLGLTYTSTLQSCELVNLF